MAEKFWADDTKGFPCKDCQDRHQACWQHCEKYIKAKQAHMDKTRARAEQKKMERVWFNVRRKNYDIREGSNMVDRREF